MSSSSQPLDVDLEFDFDLCHSDSFDAGSTLQYGYRRCSCWHQIRLTRFPPLRSGNIYRLQRGESSNAHHFASGVLRKTRPRPGPRPGRFCRDRSFDASRGNVFINGMRNGRENRVEIRNEISDRYS